MNRMFIDAYEDSMNVNSAAGSIAGARKPKKPWPPTIDSHRTDNSIGRYTDDEAYADDEDNNSTAVSGHFNALTDGDYSDAYDPPQTQPRAAKGASRPHRFGLNPSPPSVRSEATLVDDNASAYTTDIEAEPAYMDALRASPPRTRNMTRAGEMVKSMWEYQVRPLKRRCHVDLHA